MVSAAFPHFGEEDPLRGRIGFGERGGGSGTIFFVNCNLKCKFCQNHDISQPEDWEVAGQIVSAEELAKIMLGLQQRGCHNINFVSPSHVVAQILEAVEIAAKQGLKIPLVYNSGGYDSLEALKLLDCVIDIYMPDVKFTDVQVAQKLSGSKNYPEVNQSAVAEMHRQVGDLVLDDNGLATGGLLVRHLVLPGGLAGTGEVAHFLAELSKDTYVNLMDQYRPVHKVVKEPPLDRRITTKEWEEAEQQMKDKGLWRLDHVL